MAESTQIKQLKLILELSVSKAWLVIVHH